MIEEADFYIESYSNAMDWYTYTVEEVQKVIFNAGNTSPGLDETPSLIIKKAWHLYKEEITVLFQLCLQEDHHPPTFKTAILCALLKPGKRSKHLPRSYLFIVLLSSLGKVLEKIVARRLGNIGLKPRLISPLHFDAISS